MNVELNSYDWGAFFSLTFTSSDCQIIHFTEILCMSIILIYCFYRTLPRIHSHKSASLPARAKDTESPPVLDVLRVLPEDLATQITRMDFPVFKYVSNL